MAFDRRETAILLIGDFLILVASLWGALTLRNLALPSLSYFTLNLVPFLPMFLLSLVVFYIAGLYEKQTRPIRSVMGIRIFGAQAATVAIAAILFFILPLAIAPKTILVLYLVISVIGESVWRFFRMRREIQEGKREPALLVASGAAALELYEEVNGNDRYLIRFAAHLEAQGLSEEELAKAVTDHLHEGVRVVVIDTNNPVLARGYTRLYDRLSQKEAVFREFASLYEEIFDRVPFQHFDERELIAFAPKERALYDSTKRLFDIVLAAIGSFVAIPFIGIAALALSASGAPFIFNERVGKGGRTFRIIKLRSMLFNDHGNPELQKKNRVTALGRVLRKTRIDELPQLLNVLAGELSFIGPRPELPKLAEVYEREIPHYRMRHLITPGLSGWAQIHDYDAPRGGADVERTKKKLSFDLYYLKHRSFGLDLAIAIKTLRTLLAFTGT